MQTLALSIPASLSVAVVFGTDVFFTVVGRAALARSSAPSVLEVMGHLHAVADRRMPVFGVTGLLGAALLVALGAEVRPLAGIALVTQLVWLALYVAIAKPINERMAAAAQTGEPCDARELQARWESILVPRSILLGIALAALLLSMRGA